MSSETTGPPFFAAFAAGFFSVLLGGVLVAVSLIFTEENFFEVAGLVLASHLPVMIIEGFVTAFCVMFLKKVQPGLLLTSDPVEQSSMSGNEPIAVNYSKAK